MLLSALRDIWEAFREYQTQALFFGAAGALLYSVYSIINFAGRKLRKKTCKSVWHILFRIFLFTIFSIYFSYLVSLTLSGREPGSRRGHINLTLFSTLIRNGRFGLIGIENILLFIPFGILVPVLWKFYRHWWNLVLMGFITSMLVELSQLLTGRGFFELDDILLNTAGAWTGYFVFFIFCSSLYAIRRRVREETEPPFTERTGENRFADKAALIGIQLLPVLIMIAVIFGFSSDTAEESGALSSVLTGKLMMAAEQAFSLDMTEAEMVQAVEKYENIVRKGAHMLEYALLACSMAIFLYCRKMKAGIAFLLTEGFILFTASMDEWYQTGISGRSGSPADVMIDMIGAALMLLALWICLMIYRKGRSKPKSNLRQ